MSKLIVMVIASWVSLCSQFAFAQTASPPLTKEQIVQFVGGKTLPVQIQPWGELRLNFRNGGALYGNHRAGSDSGKWSTEEGKLCLAWRQWAYNGCGEFRYSDGMIEHYRPNGELHFALRICDKATSSKGACSVEEAITKIAAN